MYGVCLGACTTRGARGSRDLIPRSAQMVKRLQNKARNVSPVFESATFTYAKMQNSSWRLENEHGAGVSGQ